MALSVFVLRVELIFQQNASNESSGPRQSVSRHVIFAFTARVDYRDLYICKGCSRFQDRDNSMIANGSGKLTYLLTG